MPTSDLPTGRQFWGRHFWVQSKFPHSRQFCFSIFQPEVEEEDKTEGSSSQRDYTKEETCCWHYCQHLYLKKETDVEILIFNKFFQKDTVSQFRFSTNCGQGTWLAISSSMAASASNQRTGRKTSGIFSKNNPILGFGRSWRIIWSRIRTWQESLRLILLSPIHRRNL